jgi:hypothetical protein
MERVEATWMDVSMIECQTVKEECQNHGSVHEKNQLITPLIAAGFSDN